MLEDAVETLNAALEAAKVTAPQLALLNRMSKAERAKVLTAFQKDLKRVLIDAVDLFANLG